MTASASLPRTAGSTARSCWLESTAQHTRSAGVQHARVGGTTVGGTGTLACSTWFTGTSSQSSTTGDSRSDATITTCSRLSSYTRTEQTPGSTRDTSTSTLPGAGFTHPHTHRIQRTAAILYRPGSERSSTHADPVEKYNEAARPSPTTMRVLHKQQSGSWGTATAAPAEATASTYTITVAPSVTAKFSKDDWVMSASLHQEGAHNHATTWQHTSRGMPTRTLTTGLEAQPSPPHGSAQKRQPTRQHCQKPSQHLTGGRHTHSQHFRRQLLLVRAPGPNKREEHTKAAVCTNGKNKPTRAQVYGWGNAPHTHTHSSRTCAPSLMCHALSPAQFGSQSLGFFV